MKIVAKVEKTKVEKTVGRILSKIVGVELSVDELQQISGGSKECDFWTGQNGGDIGCDQS